jgi:hypothetical protein
MFDIPSKHPPTDTVKRAQTAENLVESGLIRIEDDGLEADPR